MQAILGGEKRNAKTITFFSIFREAFLHKERKRGTFSILKEDRDSYWKVAKSSRIFRRR